MKQPLVLATLIVLTFLAIGQDANAAVYKCKKANGTIEYSDVPCANGLRESGGGWIAIQPSSEGTPKTRKPQVKEGGRRGSQRSERNANTPGHRQGKAEEHAAGQGPTPDEIDRMTNYAVVLGRGISCGADVKSPTRRVAAWLDHLLPPGSQANKDYFPIFLKKMAAQAKLQTDGKSPDTCDAVLRDLGTFPWP